MMNFHLLKKTFYKTLFPPKFGNEKIQSLYHFISQNDNDIANWEMNGLLAEFILIIKNFDKDDIEFFFEKINLWNSYYLVIISDKFLHNEVKANIKYDIGKVYARIFLHYESLDPYYLVDNLEIAIAMYQSELDLETVIDLSNKIKLLYYKRLITKQQYDYNLTFINNLNP
nr:hypothetical protein [uncultured Chryseobacterium sp.]